MGIFTNAASYRLPFPVMKVVRYTVGGCYPVCPRCGYTLEREYMHFCDRCGQRLSWYLLPVVHITDINTTKQIGGI